MKKLIMIVAISISLLGGIIDVNAQDLCGCGCGHPVIEGQKHCGCGWAPVEA